MVLCLDVGNSQIYGGVFEGDKLKFQFRKRSKSGASSDEMGLFFRSVLQENGIDYKAIEKIAICTVVPGELYSLKGCCTKYFGLTPFVLQAGVKTGLKVKYRNPIEVGADRIANTVAASSMYPDKDLIVIDFGTATTFCALNSKKEYLGGVIMPGLKLSMTSLEANTSKLPTVEIVSPKETLGRSTVESIQSGLYWGHLGAVKEMIANLSKECFETKPTIIGTGGFTHLFRKENIFDHEVSDLVLRGLYVALKMNL